MSQPMKKFCYKNPAMRILVPFSWAFVGFFCTVLPLAAQKLSERDVEAAYLYNFGKFVTWPPQVTNGASSFDICILGRDPFGQTLNQLIENDRNSSRPIRRRLLARASDARGCAIVYISASEAANLSDILTRLDGKGDLLVSNLPHFVERGGAIQFVFAKKRVRFEVNLDAAEKNQLVFSSELLKVAARVKGRPQSGVNP
jgi:hypothetical protein